MRAYTFHAHICELFETATCVQHHVTSSFLKHRFILDRCSTYIYRLYLEQGPEVGLQARSALRPFLLLPPHAAAAGATGRSHPGLKLRHLYEFEREGIDR